jgi:hypothetical protein
MPQTNSAHKIKNVVLVHGGFVDGSGWEADVKPGLAAFMADSLVPWGVQALSGKTSVEVEAELV